MRAPPLDLFRLPLLKFPLIPGVLNARLESPAGLLAALDGALGLGLSQWAAAWLVDIPNDYALLRGRVGFPLCFHSS